MSSINYEEKIVHVLSGTSNVVTCLQHTSSSQSEIIKKVKIIRAIAVTSRVNESSKTNESIAITEQKMKILLISAKFKRHSIRINNLNVAEIRHEEQNKFSHCYQEVCKSLVMNLPLDKRHVT